MASTNEDVAKRFFDVVVNLPPERRARKLGDLCKGKDELRRAVEALLRNHDEARAEGFLDVPAVARPAEDRATPVPRIVEPPPARPAANGPAAVPPSALPPTAEVAEQPGDTIGPYKLLQVIGEGGFGVVFMAEQREPVKRRVALKVIKHGMDTKQVVARFEAERQALALMDHPNIARVLDGGATASGRPYFVMDLVKGVELTAYCDENKLGIAERLGLFVDVCRAIQHAHQKGLIHRDLKPSNVLVTQHDGRPVPIVIDFGIAKATSGELTSKTLFTEYGQFLGTPAYMSPEQAEMSGLDIDTRTDVYSLGVMLYELLTGSTPLDVQELRERGFLALIQAIRDAEAERPSTRVSTAKTASRVAAQRRSDPQKLGAMLRGDLDWIVMRCLEKDRARRYDSAAALAADIERHLSGEVVEAVPPSRAYRMRKFVRRHRGPVAAGALVTAALVLGVIGTALGMSRAMDEAARAERELARATEVSRVIKDMLLGITPEQAQGADTRLLKQIVDSTAARLDAGEVADELIAAELGVLLGSTYSAISEFDAAEGHLTRAIETYDRLLGHDDLRTVKAEQQLALLRNRQGALREALRLQREIVPRLRAAEGVTRSAVIGAEVNLGLILHVMGEKEEAAERLGRAREEARRDLGPDHDFTLNATMNYALALNSLSRVDEGLALLVEVVDARTRIHGPDHSTTLQARANQAALLIRARRFDGAERILSEVHDACARIQGAESTEALQVRVALANLYRDTTRSELAERTLLAVREVAGRTLSPEHGLNLGLHNSLAAVYLQQARREEAAAEVRQGVEVTRRVLGDRDPRALAYMSDASVQLTQAGMDAEAHELNRVVRAALIDLLGPDYRKSIVATIRLADTTSRVGDPSEAEKLARDALAALERRADDPAGDAVAARMVVARSLSAQGRRDEAADAFAKLLAETGDDDADADRIWSSAADFYVNAGRLADAEAALRRQIQLTAGRVGERSALVWQARRSLAGILAVTDRRPDAVALYRECIDGLQGAVGPDAAVTVETACFLAVQLGALQQFAEAEKLLLDATQRSERLWGRAHFITILSHRNLGMVYMDWRRLDDARRVLEIAVEGERAIGQPAAEDLNRLGSLASVRGDFAAAEPLFREAAEVGEKTLGAAHETTLDCANRHGSCLLNLGRADDAAARYERTLALTGEVLPPDHPRRVAALDALIGIRESQDRTSALVPLREARLARLGGVKEGSGADALDAAMRLASAYGAVGRSDDARKLLDQALAVAGTSAPSYAPIQLFRATLFQRLGLWDEAATAARAARDSVEERLGAGAPAAALADAILADTLLESGRVAEATAAIEARYAQIAAAAPPGHSVRRFATFVLVEALHQSHRAEDSLPALKDLIAALEAVAQAPSVPRDTLEMLATCLLRDVSTATYDPARALKLAERALEREERDAGGLRWSRRFTVALAQLRTGDREGAEATFRRATEEAPAPHVGRMRGKWEAELSRAAPR